MDDHASEPIKVSFMLSPDLFYALDEIVEESELPTMTEHISMAIAQYVFCHQEVQRGKMIIIEDLKGHRAKMLLPERRIANTS